MKIESLALRDEPIGTALYNPLLKTGDAAAFLGDAAGIVETKNNEFQVRNLLVPVKQKQRLA